MATGKNLENLGKHAARNGARETDHQAQSDFPYQRPPILDMIPYRLSLEKIRSTPTDQLLKVLTGETPERRPLDVACQQAISAELISRQAKEFARPTWWKDRNYLAGLVAAVGGAIAATPIVWGWITK